MAGRDTVENVDINLTATDKASKPIDVVAGKSSTSRRRTTPRRS
jgi:hypothetical protein